MGLLHKVRILVGVLVHKPFSPRPGKADLDQADQCELETDPAQSSIGAEAEGATTLEDDRVADLIGLGLSIVPALPFFQFLALIPAGSIPDDNQHPFLFATGNL
jgi:hypothetical protein